jgi:hypothetical protein
MVKEYYYIMCLEDCGKQVMIVSKKRHDDFMAECKEDQAKTGRIWHFIACADTYELGKQFQEIWWDSADFHWEMGYMHGQNHTGLSRPPEGGYGICTSLHMPVSQVITGNNHLKEVQDITGLDIHGNSTAGRKANKYGRFDPGQ